MYRTIVIFMLFNLSVAAQDVIITTNNEEISAKIEEYHIETISYKKFENLSGPSYHIKKSHVSKIVFENGNIETFDITLDVTNEDSLLEELKAYIIKSISEYCYEEDGFKEPYKAIFEGDYLRLIILNKNLTRERSSLLYDFENVYVFQKVSKRKNDIAFINIFVPILKNEEKNKWDKHKLIMRVDGHEMADSIVNALKQYNELLIKKRIQTGQKF